MAKVVERWGLDMEDLGSNLGGIFFLLLSTGCTSGTKRPWVIVIFEASDVTRVCPIETNILELFRYGSNNLRDMKTGPNRNDTKTNKTCE